MLESKQRTPNPILSQVPGCVLVLPLLMSFLTLPFPFGLLLPVGAIAASAYGVTFAWRHAGWRVTVFALIVTLLNVVSLVGIGEASILKGLYRLSWLFWYPHYSNWVYWNF